MKFRLVPALLTGIVLSIVVSKIAYFCFTPSYRPLIFSKQAYHGMFDHDVFKYRILGQYMLFGLDDWLSHFSPPKEYLPIPFKIEKGSEWFYYAFFYLNTFFLCLTFIVLVLLLRIKGAFKLNDAEKHLLLFLSILVICFSQSVVSPYDVSGYFFELLFLYIFLSFIDLNATTTLIALGVILFISTLNRESSALSVSLIALLLYQKWGLTKKTILSVLSLSLVFIVTYLALRYFIIDPTHQRFIFLNAGNVFVETNIIGLLFWVLFFYLTTTIAIGNENREIILFYHFLSLPYIFICFKDGVLWEVRLYIPIFLYALCLARLDLSKETLSLKPQTK